jgi:hypothetical protein
MSWASSQLRRRDPPGRRRRLCEQQDEWSIGRRYLNDQLLHAAQLLVITTDPTKEKRPQSKAA